MREFNEIKESIMCEIEWKVNYYNNSEDWTHAEAFCSLMDYIDGVSQALIFAGYQTINFHKEMLAKLDDLK